MFIAVAFSPIIYFTFLNYFSSKSYTKFQPQGSYNSGSSMRVSTVCSLCSNLPAVYRVYGGIFPQKFE